MKYLLMLAVVVLWAGVAQGLLDSVRKCVEAQTRNKALFEELNALYEWRESAPEQNLSKESSKACLIRQYLASKDLFHTNNSKWNKQKIIDTLGEDAYNYCRYELEREHYDGCIYAANGADCLIKANQNVCETRINLINCVYELRASNEQLAKYVEFPESEKVPCLFKCLAEKMQIYTENYEWDMNNWIKAFGPLRHIGQDYSICRADRDQIKNRNKCEWMYEEHVCIDRFSYSSYGIESSRAQKTTTPRNSDVHGSIKRAFLAVY